MIAEPREGGGLEEIHGSGLPGSLAADELLEATPECLVVAADGRIAFANRRVERLSGYERAELVGRPIDLLIRGGIPAEEGPSERTCRLKDGTEVPVELHVGEVVAGGQRLAVVTLRDITDLKRGEDARREAEAKYRALVEEIPAIVYIDACDEALTTLYVSPQIRELLGVEPREYLEDPDLWHRLLHPEDRDRAMEEYLRGRSSGEPFTFEYRLVGRNERTVWFRDSAVVVRDADGEAVFIQGVMLDITERKEAEEQIAFLAYHDKLTGLPNRAMFEEFLELSLARAARHDLGVGVLFLDVDNFKLVNDSLGHHAGDELLVQLAERLRGCTRETDLVARQGGDEFLLLLADLERGTGVLSGAADTPMLVAESVAVRVKEALEAPFELGGTQFYASASIGISLFPHDAHDAEELLKNADLAMYESKGTSPGGYVIYSTGPEDPRQRLSFATRLRKAVEEQHWLLHYQPIVQLFDGRIVGVEALIRWQDPNGGIVPPGEFIPVAEEMGLIGAIGDWVIEEFSEQQRRWREAGLEMEVSFNLSPRQLWQASLPEKVQTRLASAGIDPHTVTVEITESTAMADPERTQRMLLQLHAWGLRLAIDDFGTGYSSLSRLKHLPVDVLKIDRSFIRGVDRDGDAASMVQAMIQLARNLDMTPLAEGVETAEELVFLQAHGCTLGQGFYFSRPVTAPEIERLWRERGGQLLEANEASS